MVTLFILKAVIPAFWVNLFIPSQLNWTDRKMIVTQDTDIPSSDKTVLTVKTEKTTVCYIPSTLSGMGGVHAYQSEWKFCFI